MITTPNNKSIYAEKILKYNVIEPVSPISSSKFLLNVKINENQTVTFGYDSLDNLNKDIEFLKSYLY